MKLSDFYFEDKAQIGSHMAIPLPNGDDSGEWLNIVAPEADAAVRAGRAFLFAYLQKKDELAPLEAKGKDSGEMTEYYLAMNEASEDLNRHLAAELVNGWSFDEPFSKESLVDLLSQYRQLGTLVANFYNAQKKELEAK